MFPRLSDPNAEIDDETGDKIVGWIATATLMLGQWPLFLIADAVGDQRADTLARTWTSSRFLWDGDTNWSIPANLTVLAPLILLPGAFGVKWRQIVPRLEPVSRWRLVLGLVLVIALAHGLNAFMTKRDLGVATEAEAVWTHNSQIVRRAAWPSAVAVEVSCEMVKHRRRADLEPSLNYRVRFADGRVAPLSRTVNQDTAAWTEALAPIDAVLRLAKVQREGIREPACLTAYAEKLEGAPPGAFWSIMGD